MKYAVIQCSNGNFSIASEWSEPEKAIVDFHTVCKNLWNAPDVEHACVTVINEKFNVEKIEFIKYNTQANA